MPSRHRPCSGAKAITQQMVRTFAKAARQRISLKGGSYRRDHLRALAQRVKVAEGEVRIMGSKTRFLQAIVGKPGAIGVPSQGRMWSAERDPNYPFIWSVPRIDRARLREQSKLA